jgi:branched-chain amino acid aminotransferase
MTDHMLEVDWTAEAGWGAPAIVPYAKLQLDPAATVLHYGVEVRARKRGSGWSASSLPPSQHCCRRASPSQAFEGMKAYRRVDGRAALFRPDLNMKRLSFSMDRLAGPPLDADGFTEAIKGAARGRARVEEAP